MWVSARFTVVLGLALVLGATSSASQALATFQGEVIERDLQEGRIVRMVSLDQGVTAPRRATIDVGNGETRDAVFKTIDFFRPGVTQLDSGQVEWNMTDQWQTEIAAYQIDRLIGLGMVPATVEREYRGQRGSLQAWVEIEWSEAARRRNGIEPPDREGWNQQQQKMQLFDNLIFNTDRHLNNILVTRDFQLRLIDHSRSFRTFGQLRDEDQLVRFSRSLLAGLERLERDDLRKRIGRHVDQGKIDALLQRRDRILELAKERVAERGEENVLFP